MWRCTKCETDNADTDILCSSCDWHSPELKKFEAKLIEGKELTTYLIKWEFSNTKKTFIDNGIGEVSTTGEINFSIKEKTELIFSCENKHSQKIFTKTLLLPSPVIENFIASHKLINLNEPITLTWITKYADKVWLTDIGDVTEITKKEVLLRKTSSLILTAENSTSKQEKVLDFELPLPKITFFNSDLKKIIAGDELILTWESTNAETIILKGLEKEEILSGGKHKIRLEKTAVLKLFAQNNSGEIFKELSVEILPKPEIKLFRINKSISLPDAEVEVNWEVANYSKVFLLFDDKVIDVTDKTSYKFFTDNSKELKLICESIEKIKSISQTILLKVIERVSIDSFTTSSNYTIQSKPVTLKWEINNATEIILLPSGKKLKNKGNLNVLPSTKTTFIIEAKNELTTDRKEIEIDVLPLPTISNIKLSIPPLIKLPLYTESKIKFPTYEKKESTFLFKARKYLLQKFIIKEPKSIKTTFISFNQHFKNVEIKKENSIMNIVNLLKNSPKS